MAYVSAHVLLAVAGARGTSSADTNRFPAERGYDYSDPFLAVSLDQVKLNFSRFDLLDEQVQFVKGWFKDTLPN
jgi:O-methyltransferase